MEDSILSANVCSLDRHLFPFTVSSGVCLCLSSCLTFLSSDIILTLSPLTDASKDQDFLTGFIFYP